MKSHNVKVKAGQIWINGNNKKITISNVAEVGNYLWAFHKTMTGNEQEFGQLTEDSYPDDWGLDWKCIQGAEDCNLQSSAEKAHSAEKVYNDLLTFFSAVPDGYCACNIKKIHCSYHKDTK